MKKPKPTLDEVEEKEREVIETELAAFQQRETFFDAYKQIDEAGIRSFLSELAER